MRPYALLSALTAGAPADLSDLTRTPLRAEALHGALLSGHCMQTHIDSETGIGGNRPAGPIPISASRCGPESLEAAHFACAG
jgi:hypothetical protein